MKLFILIFLFIYAPVLRPIGNWLDLSFFISFFIVIFNNKSILHKFFFPNYLKKLFPIIIVFAYSLFLIVDYGSFEFDQFIFILFKPVKIIFTALAAYYIVKIFFNNYKDDLAQYLLKFIYLSIALHGLIMLLQFIFPSFKDFIYSFTNSLEFRSSFEYNFRMGGLSGGSGGAVLSVVQSIGLLIMPFLNMKNLYKFISFTIILISIFLCGRSGFWAFIIFMPLSYGLSQKNLFYGIKKQILFFGFIVAGIFILISQLKFYSDLEILTPLRRTLDSFIYYDSSLGFEDATFNELLTNIIFPEDLMVLIFGSGDALFNTQFSRNLDSDIGYIRDLWSFGFLISLLYWFPIFYYFIYAFKNLYKNKFFNLLFILSSVMITFHAKESFLYVRMFWPIYTLILGTVYFKNLQKNIC